MMKRREFLRSGLGAASLAALGDPGGLVTRVLGAKATARKLLILGFDGMDPGLVQAWMDEGKLPAFRKLAAQGGFKALGTSHPPQSPVAWSNFITGMNPGGHGIFDFIHRDPKTYFPVFSATETAGASKTVKVGKYLLPIKSPEIRNLRHGRAFWQILEDHGIPSVVFKMPANYPPVETRQRSLSGMGTPDLFGSYGTLQYFTTEAKEVNEDIGGARVTRVFVIGGRVESVLLGPKNTFLEDAPDTEIPFRVDIDPQNAVARISFAGQELLLREKEWSGWKRLRFPLMPTKSASGICLFYLKQLRPEFKLYVSPLNVDPADPALPISTPPSYAKELAERFGPFFTKGLPADTSALDNDILDEEEFLHQDDIVLEERRAMLDFELSRFESGVLFYYVSSTDQRQHMFWRLFDRSHPAYDEKLAREFGGVVERIYRSADEMLAEAMSRAGKDTDLLVLSDHGFNPFVRGFNLNTWLRRNGYLRLRNEFRSEDLELAFAGTNWGRTKAYGLGLNGLYLNLKDREAEGIVAPEEAEALLREIAAKLEAEVDPKTGRKVVERAYLGMDLFPTSTDPNRPDILVGYNRGYRVSWRSPLGRVPKDVLEDNTQKWSGDHMGAAELLPGIVLANRPIRAESPSLTDLTATVLDVFGIEPPEEMIGKTVF
jgi:predicted AlkP superfamily phosphohydrolase/phosphomutase